MQLDTKVECETSINKDNLYKLQNKSSIYVLVCAQFYVP